MAFIIERIPDEDKKKLDLLVIGKYTWAIDRELNAFFLCQTSWASFEYHIPLPSAMAVFRLTLYDPNKKRNSRCLKQYSWASDTAS